MLVGEMLRAIMAGGSVSDEDVKRAASAIVDYEITSGDMSQAWHTCRPEELDACWNAYRSLAERARALTAPAPMTAAEQEMVDLTMELADVEERAQNAEDREQVSRASKLRAKARELKAKIAALRSA